MSKNKPKTRFVATYGGAMRELFAVREGGDGTLVLMIRPESKDGPDSTFASETWKCYRFSVHPSNRGLSPGTLIKGTMLTEEGRSQETAQYINGDKKSLCAMVFTKASPELDQRYLPNIRQSDEIICMQKFEKFDLATLVYTVIVSGTGIALPTPELGFSLCFKDYSEFRLNVYSSLTNTPATRHGSIGYEMTSFPKIDGEQESEIRFEQKQSRNFRTLDKFLLKMSQRVAAIAVEGFADENILAGPAIRRTPLWFHANAIVLRSSRIARKFLELD